MGERSVTVAAAGRPRVGESVSGDGWTVDRHEGACRIAVIDGLGHGEEAARARQAAVVALAARPELGPGEALLLCHAALRGTRGAAISIASIDPTGARLTYAGVGNVEARLWQNGAQERPITYRGIVGVAIRTVRGFELTLEPGWLLLMHTDGVSARFDTRDLASLDHGDPRSIAAMVLDRWGQARDDATVVVARPARAHDQWS